MDKAINVTRSSMPTLKEYLVELQDIWNNNWLTNMGEKHKELERGLKGYLDVPDITLFTNGHLALEAAISAFDLSGEVITTPFTFASTTHAIIRCGLTPVFCDINSDDYTIDVSKIESLITEKTCAIIPVHVYGNMCDVDEIHRIAKKHALKVIYDAAHAFGVKLNGVGVGNFGDASMFSFHATKVFHTIEGGALTYSSLELAAKLDCLKNFGITGPENVVAVGGNAKMNEFQAAMGICNLRHIDEEISKRDVATQRYTERLSGAPGIKLCSPRQPATKNHAYFPVIFEKGPFGNRNQVFERLAASGINTRKYFYPLTSQFVAYVGTFPLQATPVAEYIAENVLCLPMFSGLETHDVDTICDVILEEK